MRTVALIPDSAGQTFTFVPDADLFLAGVFATLGRAVVTSDGSLSIAQVFSFPPSQVQLNDVIAITEKVFIPVGILLKKDQSVFVFLESQGPFMLFLSEVQLPLITDLS